MHSSQPYAGQHARDIKSLSAEEVNQYLAGAGAGFAKPAELNHYPGPAHVIELADKLDLSAEQRAQVQALMDAHKEEAKAAGARVVELERKLDALFRAGDVSESRLAATVQEAAQAQGAYRLTHLDTHRKLRSMLTDAQVARYDELRGYGSGAHRHAH
jgi:Spy/CpxP family protein refolding chaperone